MNMPLTELPLGLPGKVFRSPMPFGGFDPDGNVLQAFKRYHISVVVLLVDDDECRSRVNCNLRERYLEEGLKVIHLPIRDRHVATDPDLQEALRATIEHAKNGSHIAIHCYAGLGRTGMFAACLSRRVLGLTGEEAIRWIRRHVPGAIETQHQEQIVLTLDCSPS